MKKAVLVDIDDTIADTQANILKHINLRSEKEYKIQEITRAWREGADPEYEKHIKWILSEPELMNLAEPYRDAVESMGQLHRAGFEVHVASARKENLHESTLLWLKVHNFVDHITQVHGRMSHDRSLEFKCRAAREAGALVAFDDTADVAEALEETGLTVYLIDKPWNQEIRKSEKIIRVPSFADGVAILLK